MLCQFLFSRDPTYADFIQSRKTMFPFKQFISGDYPFTLYAIEYLISVPTRVPTYDFYFTYNKLLASS
jgi:hypothetical protein